MKDKLIFWRLLSSIDTKKLGWGKYTVRSGKNKGQLRKALVFENQPIFLASTLTQEEVRKEYENLVISTVGENKVVHFPGITAEEAF
jgi:hypothetical protein